jgi:hypothetical protein
LKASIISSKYGWYIARVNASFDDFSNIIIASVKTIQKYKLKPGYYIKISNLDNSHSRIKYLDKFILLPYLKEFLDYYYLLQEILQSITNRTYHFVDKDYINIFINLMSRFYHSNDIKREFLVKDIYEFERQEKKYMDIAMPESWLDANDISLGESVLLRNDDLPPVFL